MAKEKQKIRFVRIRGRIVPIRVGKTRLRLPISGERLRVVGKSLKTKFKKERSIFKAKFFKPRKLFGIDFNPTGDIKTFRLLKELNARIEVTVEGRKAFVLKTPRFKKVKVKSIKVRD